MTSKRFPRARSVFLPAPLVAFVTIAIIAAPGIARAQGSADARESTTVALHVMPVGFIPRIAYGATAGFHFGAALQVEGYYEYGRISNGLVFDDSKRTRFGTRALWFPGNSFFASVGAGYDAYENEESDFVKIIGRSSDTETAWKGEYSQIDAELALGNRWQFESGFSIGATWFGVSQGIAKITKTSTIAKPASLTQQQVDDTKKREDDDLEEQATALSVHFAKFQVGWAF